MGGRSKVSDDGQRNANNKKAKELDFFFDDVRWREM